jgi:hypothetical protein
MSNRFTWAWKLAEFGKPIILIYLGFLACDEMDDMIGPRTHATRVTLPEIYLGSKAIDSKVFLVEGPRQDVLPDICGYLGTSALKPRRMEFDIAGNHFKWR